MMSKRTHKIRGWFAFFVFVTYFMLKTRNNESRFLALSCICTEFNAKLFANNANNLYSRYMAPFLSVVKWLLLSSLQGPLHMFPQPSYLLFPSIYIINHDYTTRGA